jgi:hypothetical protein
MSLDYDLTRVENRHENFPRREDGGMNNVTETLIFATMTVGMGEITEETAPEFYARLSMYEHLFRPFLMKVDDDGTIVPRFITLDEVKGHIGLRTNVFPMQTRGKWVAHMGKRFIEETISEAKKS